MVLSAPGCVRLCATARPPPWPANTHHCSLSPGSMSLCAASRACGRVCLTRMWPSLAVAGVPDRKRGRRCLLWRRAHRRPVPGAQASAGSTTLEPKEVFVVVQPGALAWLGQVARPSRGLTLLLRSRDRPAVCSPVRARGVWLPSLQGISRRWLVLTLRRLPARKAIPYSAQRRHLHGSA